MQCTWRWWFVAIGWELGYLLTLSNQGIDVRHADLMIGTSGGAQVAQV